MQKYFLPSLVLFAIFGISLGHAETAATDPKVAETIEFLLASIAKSECIFVRNGKDHSGAESAKHIRAKYDYFKKKIATPEDFIRLAGTQSALTKKPYTVKDKSGNETTSAAWLGEVLQNYRQAKNPVLIAVQCLLPAENLPGATSAMPPTSPAPR